MIKCPYCGMPNRRGSRYCSNCGQRLEEVSGIACSACERLNPLGSTFCAFCGALLVSSVPAAESATGQTAPRQEETGKEGMEAVTPQRELPSWLYEELSTRPKDVSLSAAAPLLVEEERNKYLRGIQGVLPSTDKWLASSMQLEIGKTDSTANKPTTSKTAKRMGCLTVGLMTLLGIIGFAWVSVTHFSRECNKQGGKR
nr:zinc ribbon domain-containing protein [Chloroflexota bacterium]